ncbi:MAG: hypothetical protein JWQ95_5665 [Sphaerisporangium sp.]|jgi:hypothetical protein|nr:hypothetical protein [Sphaerisporangium sp.]
MSLFDMFKDKAAELVQGAKDKVAELTGAELTVDGVIGGATEQADQVAQTVEGIQQEGQNLVEGTETTATDTVNKILGE